MSGRRLTGRRLTGRRVLVTRPRDRALPLVAALEGEGADVLLVPTLEIAAPVDRSPLEAAAARPDAWDWVVFPSVYAVRAFREVSGVAGGPREAGRPRCACVGTGTADAARAAGWTPDVVPEAASARGLVAALRRRADLRGARVLLPMAADARPELAVGLRAAGAEVNEVVAYRKVVPREAEEALARLLRAGGVEAVTFTSPSSVRNFLGLSSGDVAPEARVVVIGGTTAAAAEAAGLRVTAVAEEATVAGLVEAVVRAFNR